jgi:hypothetical protein
MAAQPNKVIAHRGRWGCLELLLTEPLEALVHVLKSGSIGARLSPEIVSRTHVRILANSYSKSSKQAC